MPIDFNEARWDKVKETYRLWWAGQLDRPIVPVELEGRDPGRAMPDAPLLSQATCMELSVSPEALVDRLDYELSTKIYLGDAFPFFDMGCFGPGVVAAFLGARLDNSTGRVWFYPREELPITELHFEYDPDNVWFKRIKDICAAAMERWQGQVMIGMTDLGGVLDILSTFRPAEKLLLALYDHPEEVKRLIWEIHEIWHRCFEEINTILQPANGGFVDWGGIYSDESFCMLQSDFCYMIGPDMFDEFVKPELEATSRRLSRSFYHLDGPGQLPHIDSLLTIDRIDGVQWVQGFDDTDSAHYPELFRKIHAAGKLIQCYADFDALDAIISQIGTGKGIHRHPKWGYAPITGSEREIRKRLKTYGIE